MSAVVRRVLIALDPVMSRRSAVRAVMSLKGDLESEVQALFVEDARLFRIANLPVAREITLQAEERLLAAGDVERQLRVLATRLRQELEVEAGQVGLRCGFRVARGDFPSELLSAASLADVLVLAHFWSAVPEAFAAQLPLQALLLHGPQVLVFVPDRWPSGGRVVVLSPDADSQHAMQVGTSIAEHERLDLVVLQSQVMTRLRVDVGGDRNKLVAAVERPLPRRIDVAVLARACITEDAGVLVLPAALLSSDPDVLKDLLRRVSCPVVTVR